MINILKDIKQSCKVSGQQFLNFRIPFHPSANTADLIWMDLIIISLILFLKMLAKLFKIILRK